MSDTLNAPANAHWYVAQIKPNGFDRAVANLAQQGFESFMPMQQQILNLNFHLDSKNLKGFILELILI